MKDGRAIRLLEQIRVHFLTISRRGAQQFMAELHQSYDDDLVSHVRQSEVRYCIQIRAEADERLEEGAEPIDGARQVPDRDILVAARLKFRRPGYGAIDFVWLVFGQLVY